MEKFCMVIFSIFFASQAFAASLESALKLQSNTSFTDLTYESKAVEGGRGYERSLCALLGFDRTVDFENKTVSLSPGDQFWEIDFGYGFTGAPQLVLRTVQGSEEIELKTISRLSCAK